MNHAAVPRSACQVIQIIKAKAAMLIISNDLRMASFPDRL
jgi:hypothetical protein